jgi:gliding motility-associated-like protein
MKGAVAIIITVLCLVVGANQCRASGAFNRYKVAQAKEDSCSLLIPNAITANGDGLYQGWKMIFSCRVDSFEVQVFNRWGELKYRSNNPVEAWDPIYHCDTCPAGAYVYAIRCKFRGQEGRTYTGVVTVIK